MLIISFNSFSWALFKLFTLLKSAIIKSILLSILRDLTGMACVQNIQMSYTKISLNSLLLNFSHNTNWYIFSTYGIHFLFKEAKSKLFDRSSEGFHHIPKCQKKMRNREKLKWRIFLALPTKISYNLWWELHFQVGIHCQDLWASSLQ